MRTVSQKEKKLSIVRWVWWYTFVISTLWRLWQDCEFKASLDYIVKPCVKKKKIHFTDVLASAQKLHMCRPGVQVRERCLEWISRGRGLPLHWDLGVGTGTSMGIQRERGRTLGLQ
jgi:hypothetical protein